MSNSDQLCELESAAEFPEGSLVSLSGLTKLEYNHHIGRVVCSAGKNGRVGVSLHNAIFANASPRHRSKQYDAISFKRENLRKVLKPAPGSDLIVLGTIPRLVILRSFGESGWGLPSDIAERIMMMLIVQALDPSEVRVSGCSSDRGDYPISTVLNSHEDEWWISESNSMPGGVGSEYLEFSFGGLRRISHVALKIPPLPQGPLSVRHFHILALRPGIQLRSGLPSDAWVAASPNPLWTLDRAGLQEFELSPGIEAEAVRLVCTRTAAACQGQYSDCIGLFQVAWA